MGENHHSQIIYYRIIAILGGLYPLLVFAFLPKFGPPNDLLTREVLLAAVFGPVFLGGWIAHRFRRRRLLWALGCFFYGLPLFALALLGPKSNQREGKLRCPFCGSNIIVRPEFGGHPLPGAPEPKFLQLRGFYRCESCGEFF